MKTPDCTPVHTTHTAGSGHRHPTRALALVTAALCLAGCGHLRETLPQRSATEQLLISTAADRAVARLPADVFRGRRVFVDSSNLEGYDHKYVIQRVRRAVLRGGGQLAESRGETELVLEVASGGLSTDRRDSLFGIPELPFPLPFAGETLATPEVPLFKRVTATGRAKLSFSLWDVAAKRLVAEIPLCYGAAEVSAWWLFLLGPVRRSDIRQGDDG